MSDLTVLSEDATLRGPASDDADQAAPPADHDSTTPPEASGGTETADESKTTTEWMQAFSDAADPLELLQRVAQTVSREELLRNPTLAGIVGDAADKLERRRSKERDDAAEVDRRRKADEDRDRELDELVENEDILSLGERTLEERRALREQRERETADTARLTEANAAFQGRAIGSLNAFVDAQPAPIRLQLQELARTRQSAYAEAGDWDKGYSMWLADLVSTTVEHARSDWERTTREALRREVLGEIEGGEAGASPEIGSSGSAAGGELVTQSEWDANRRDTAWRRTNLPRIMRSLAAGHIRE